MANWDRAKASEIILSSLAPPFIIPALSIYERLALGSDIVVGSYAAELS